MTVPVGRTVLRGPWDSAFDIVSKGCLVTQCGTWDPGLSHSDMIGHLCIKRVLGLQVWGGPLGVDAKMNDRTVSHKPCSVPDQGSEGEMIGRQWLRKQKHQTGRGQKQMSRAQLASNCQAQLPESKITDTEIKLGSVLKEMYLMMNLSSSRSDRLIQC